MNAEDSLIAQLVKDANEIAAQEPALLDSFDGFTCVMWPDNETMKHWNMNREEFARCIKHAWWTCLEQRGRRP
jgi:hypothetical protein